MPPIVVEIPGYVPRDQPPGERPTLPDEPDSSSPSRPRDPDWPPTNVYGFDARRKRRKIQVAKTEVISLLSDDEDTPTTKASAATKRQPPPSPHNGPESHAKQHKTERRAKKKAAAKAVMEPRDTAPSMTTKESMRAAKAFAKSAIKQRSTPSSEPEFLSTSSSMIHPSPTPLPSTAQSAFGDRSTAGDFGGSHQTTSPLLSSSTGTGSFLSSQIMSSSQPVPADAPKVTAPEEPRLCPEQANLVELIASGKNVFYTGSAGCGKSTVLKAFTKRLREMGKSVRIVAPTGRAALQINGSTTWTFAGWTPDHHKRTLDELRLAAHGKYVSKRFRETDVLVIDEISMVENLHFERLNEVMKAARNKSYMPDQPAFGGVQIIVTGDFCQLPPVKPFQHCIQCGYTLTEKDTADGRVYVCKRHGEYRDEDKWAFRSKAWEECDFVHVHLNTIHRQNDETFIRILQKCRVGRALSAADTELLMNHKCMVQHATRLFATREEVANVNRREFERLRTKDHPYWCLDYFQWNQEMHPHLGWKSMRKPAVMQSQGSLRALDDHRFDECVQLKQGMLVVLLVNLDLEAGLCNGSQGMICGFEKYDPAKLTLAAAAAAAKGMMFGGKNSSKGGGDGGPDGGRAQGERAELKEQLVRRFIEDPGAPHKAWPVVRFHNGQVRAVRAECSVAELGDERPYSLLARTQIPLAPAWAMTIHKSQSLTLDRVVVDLSRAFEEGQVYVALSRASGLAGLKIDGSAAGLLAGLGGNPQVQGFLRDKFGVDLTGRAGGIEDRAASGDPEWEA